jgi:hypothetical protein
VEAATARDVTELPPRAQVLAELLFREMQATVGNWMIGFWGTDGKPRKWRREETGGVDDLVRFESPE